MCYTGYDVNTLKERIEFIEFYYSDTVANIYSYKEAKNGNEKFI